MSQLRPRHAVLTGAPGAGKTTLLNAVAEAGFCTSPEVARQILRQPGGLELRQADPLAFAEAMLEAHVREFERHTGYDELVVFDRGVVDVVGFLAVSGLTISPVIDRACRMLRYHGPILRAPGWPAIYAQDSERIQDWEQAVASDEAVTAAWRQYGYAVVSLPFVPVTERLAYLMEIIESWRPEAASPSVPTAC